MTHFGQVHELLHERLIDVLVDVNSLQRCAEFVSL